jgi:hypothetical protein
VKCGNKFVAKSSGLTVVEKATIVTVKIPGEETCSASAGGSDVAWAPTHAVDLFGSGSLASDDESTPRELPHKHVVDNGIEYYDLLLEGNKSLLAKRDDFHLCCEDLQAELAEVRSKAKK